MHFLRRWTSAREGGQGQGQGQVQDTGAVDTHDTTINGEDFSTAVLPEDHEYVLVEETAPRVSEPTLVTQSGDIVPELFADCRTFDQKATWCQTDYGQLVLAKRPVLQEYYKSGYLLSLFKNKHWTTRLEQWLTLPPDTDTVPPGANLPLTEAEKEKLRDDWIGPKFTHPPLHEYFKECYEMFKAETMPLENKLELVADGFTVLRGVVPSHVVEIANAAITDLLSNTNLDHIGDKKKINPLSRNQDPLFLSGGTNHLDVLSLYYASPIQAIVEDLLHGGSNQAQLEGDKGVACEKRAPPPFRAAVGGGQIAFRLSQPRSQSHARKIGGLSWHIDGLDKGKYGSFNFLIGFPLSDQPQTSSGNLCVHPQSHYALQPYLKSYAMQSFCAENDRERYQVDRIPRPDLGEPVQVCLNAGDVVMAFHKVAHLGGANYSGEVRKMVYMRVSHKNHQELRVDALDDMWIEYEGLQDLVYG